MEDGLIILAVLEDLAGTTAFRRGEEYFSVGAVGCLRATDDKVAAKVEGTATYKVELRDDDGDLAYDCTCPRAADGYFCKHCVAVGLAWLAENFAAPKSGAASGKKKRRDPWRDIKEYLTTQVPETLIELLLDVAQRDDRLYQSLLLKAERTGGSGNVAKAFRRAIDGATRIHGFVDWREVGSGDVDELVAIKSRDLSSSYCYLDIAEIWTKAKQPDKALEWAERGLKAFPDRPDNRLRDFLVAAYLKRKRHDEALQLTWIQFEERPSLEHYKKLHDLAGKLGLWPEQRIRALAQVAEVIAREANTTSRWKPKPSTPTTRCGWKLLYGSRTWMRLGRPRMKAPAIAAC
ncbi:MAG: SWIM zinc finger family protein [Sulfuritalea sp.]|nr:SWIM zinc finger family protein [Sulfuritalea sp.]